MMRLVVLGVLIWFLGLLAGSGQGTLRAAPAEQGDAPTDSPVILAAGDIANCTNEEDFLTAYLMDEIDGTILALGDNAYEIGSLQEYNDCYGPSWGRHKERTKSVPGNHEYGDQGQAGYWAYWGDVATPLEPGCRENCKGYYSFDVGEWHIVALNSEINSDAGSEQEQWLRADLAANPTACTLAFWHRPRFTSGRYFARTSGHGIFQALYDYGADVVLVGHDHDYERFAPQNPAGELEYDRGIRQFVVGTGGAPTRDFFFIQPNSEVRDSETHGVLKMTLHPTSYEWEFLPIPGQSFTDSGATDCVQLESVPPPPAGFENLVTTDTEADSNATPVSDAPSAAPATAAPATSATTSASNGRYTVQSGDTLSTIGLRFGVAWTEIASANDLTEESIIQIGQVLIIPGAASSAGTEADAAAASSGAAATPDESDTAAESVTPPRTTTPSGATYTVVEGDTLFGIAARYGLTWEELADANGLSESDFLQIGQALVIPGQAAEQAEDEPTPVAEDAANL
jgi:LysM repeat protein